MLRRKEHKLNATNNLQLGMRKNIYKKFKINIKKIYIYIYIKKKLKSNLVLFPLEFFTIIKASSKKTN